MEEEEVEIEEARDVRNYGKPRWHLFCYEEYEMTNRENQHQRTLSLSRTVFPAPGNCYIFRMQF